MEVLTLNQLKAAEEYFSYTDGETAPCFIVKTFASSHIHINRIFPQFRFMTLFHEHEGVCGVQLSNSKINNDKEVDLNKKKHMCFPDYNTHYDLSKYEITLCTNGRDSLYVSWNKKGGLLSLGLLKWPVILLGAAAIGAVYYYYYRERKANRESSMGMSWPRDNDEF